MFHSQMSGDILSVPLIPDGLREAAQKGTFYIPDDYCGQPELFRSPLLYLRRWTWGPIVAQPLLILLVMLDPGTAHPVFSLDAPRKVG